MVVFLRYFAYGSPIFLKSNILEIKELFGTFNIESSFVNSYIISAHATELKNRNGIAPIFLNKILKINCTKKISEEAYLQDIKEAVLLLSMPNKRIKIECVDINSRRGYSSKDIEVFLGESLEKLGVKINLKIPELLLYVILFDMRCHVGMVSYKKVPFIDSGRHYKSLSSSISRAEFKIMEAFDYFNINLKNGKVALDLGAAPGGWSTFMAKKGLGVIAIDQGELNSKRISELGITYSTTDNTIHSKLDSKAIKVMPYEILHIKKRFQDASELISKYKKISLITCDMNVSPEESANAVLLFKDKLISKGILIFTIKCKTKYAKKYSEEAVSILSNYFDIKKIIALPSNRQELTLFARKK